MYAGATALIDADLINFPEGLVGYGFAAWPTTDTMHVETKVDWIEVYGTELGASVAGDAATNLFVACT